MRKKAADVLSSVVGKDYLARRGSCSDLRTRAFLAWNLLLQGNKFSTKFGTKLYLNVSLISCGNCGTLFAFSLYSAKLDCAIFSDFQMTRDAPWLNKMHFQKGLYALYNLSPKTGPLSRCIFEERQFEIATDVWCMIYFSLSLWSLWKGHEDRLIKSELMTWCRESLVHWLLLQLCPITSQIPRTCLFFEWHLSLEFQTFLT